jgi:glycosyltransferase involved in cell wall biosynthesis
MTPGRPAVSVITAAYNRSEVLQYAIRSVLAQRFQDLELLVVGDACTDESEAVVRGFDDPRVKWDNLPQNSGSQAGPNSRGLELAQAELVAYLGQDDLWHPDHLEVLVTAIRARQCDLVYR